MTAPSRIRRLRARRLANQALPLILLGALAVFFLVRGNLVP